MLTNQQVVEFHSVIAPLIQQFIQEKRACGYNYQSAPRILKELDSFLCNTTLKQIALPKKLVLQWLAKRSNEQASTQQRRICFVRQLAQFMVRLGYSAYIVPGRFGTPRSNRFSPYIFTQKEIRKLIHAVDQLKPSAISPIRHLVIPEIFRLLYGCGFRVMEVLSLRVGDVDLERGVITVRDTKFGKDRLIPPAPDIVKRLRIYTKRLEKVWLEKRTDDAFFFPSAPQTAWSHSGVYILFRKLLYQCGISHRGRGKGLCTRWFSGIKKVLTSMQSCLY
jgi:integrase/recombinase XerD